MSSRTTPRIISLGIGLTLALATVVLSISSAAAEQDGITGTEHLDDR